MRLSNSLLVHSKQVVWTLKMVGKGCFAMVQHKQNLSDWEQKKWAKSLYIKNQTSTVSKEQNQLKSTIQIVPKIF